MNTRPFFTAFLLLLTHPLQASPVHLVDEKPVVVERISPKVVLLDFGKVAFGNLRITPPAGSATRITLHFGEALKGGRIDRKPPGTVRYQSTELSLAGDKPLVAAPPVDKRNTEIDGKGHPPAILTPPEWGVVMPFRWVEIEGWPGEVKPSQILRQAAFSATWDDAAASFSSSDPVLNQIWELCRYSIKATTFAGIYIDGDRERIPYEADAYLNQLSHYATDTDVQMARDSFDHLMKHPTWPTEWAFHMIFMAHADFMRTGDKAWLEARYESLKPKLLSNRARADGLLVSSDAQTKHDDIVDWPQTERDQYDFKPVNTVVNAFHIRSLGLMAEMASVLGNTLDASDYSTREEKAREAFNAILFDPAAGAYRDGEGSSHYAQHASLFPLAFGLVPQEHRAKVAAWVAERGMACSVYAAQYLMEGLFMNGAEKEALALITAPGDRSWKHMLDSGTTITWEAWDQKYKPNQDWNHAWGAAPANLFPRFVLGVQPLAPGWQKALIRPITGDLKFALGKVPTALGPIQVKWENPKLMKISIRLPEGMSGKVELPAPAASKGVVENGKVVPATRQGDRWLLDEEITGTRTFEVR
ncbi:MAG: family 78 glycoside hydrolase catalytic domain [Verrucomicrobiota bacterium]